MQNQVPTLPKDFLSFDDTIKLIQSDTREEPKVDIGFIADNLNYILPRHTFTLRLLKRNGQGKIIKTGIRFVYLANEYEASTFEHEVVKKYEELTRQSLNLNPVKKVSTTVSDSENGGNLQGIMVDNSSSKTQVGDSI